MYFHWQLVKEKQSQDRYAMKRIRKSGITSSQVREERDIMAQHKSDWITSLQYAFQDQEHLYLVMEYLPGGDLLSLMIRNGSFEEDWVRFYLAELTEALHTLHGMGYVHRDIKPENILVDRCGHLKLADFGNAAQLNKDGSVISLSPVGTPDYIAPELLQTLSTINITKSVHDVTCDFWSMGIIGYELVTEVTPFHEENVHETYSKILYHCDAHSLKLDYPDKVNVSAEFKSLIDSLVTNVDQRLSYDKIVRHRFFKGIDFATLRDQVPPIIPSVSGDDDTSNFEDIDRKGRRSTFLKKKGTPLKKPHFSGEDLPYIGYSFVYQEPDVCGVRFGDPSVDNQMVKLQAKVKEQNKTIIEQNIEIKSLQRNVMVQDKRVAEMSSSGKVMRETRVEVENLKEALKEKTKELASSKTEVKTLKSSLKIEEEQRLKSDTSIAEVLQSTYQKWEKAKKLSDQNYEKQIAEKRSDIQQLNEKLKLNETQLRNQLSECGHLQDSVKNYKEMVKKSKEQLVSDRNEFEKAKQEMAASYEEKVAELKKQLREEQGKRMEVTGQHKKLRSELRESISAHDSITGVKRSLDKGMLEMRSRIDQQIEENRSLREAKVAADKALVELQRKFEELNEKMVAQQEEAAAAQASNRSSLTEEAQFRSAQGSLQDINAAMLEEQLRHDLTVAQENVLRQQRRADDLEKIKDRLEEAIAKMEGSTVGGLLERQNSKLEDQLIKAREDTIVERQASRSAHLSVYKLEKQLEELTAEKKLSARRCELMEQRMARMKEEKQELEGRIKINAELIANKDREMTKLRREIDDLKDEVRKENENWRDTETERMKEKREIIEHIARVQKLEELIEEGKRRLVSLQQKNESLQFENKRLINERDMGDSEQGHLKDSLHGIQVKYDNLNHNYNMLKEACNITDVQMYEMEQLLEREQKHGVEAKKQLDEQVLRIKEKDEELAVVRTGHTTEMAKRKELEEKCAQLQADLLDARDQLEKVATNMATQQESLIDKTSDLFMLQERVEVLTVELDNLQHSNVSYLKEVEILKEENSRILTEYFVARENGQRTTGELKQAAADLHEMRQEIEHLNQILAEQKNYYVQRDIKSEATLAQHKKLIDYLQAKVEDLSTRKKKSLVEKIFGTHDNESNPGPMSTHRKENVPPPPVTDTLQYRKIQEDLRRERCRNNQLKEKLLRTKSQLIKSHTPSAPPAPESNIAITTTTKRTLISSVTHPSDSMEVESCNKEEERLVRKEIGWSFKEPKTVASSSTASSSESEGLHRFELTLESPSKAGAGLYCLACRKPVLTSNTFMRCKGCRVVIHRKCRSDVPASAASCDSTTDCGSLSLAASTTGPSLEAIDAVDGQEGRVIVTSATIESSRKDYGGDFLFRTKDMSPPVLVHCVFEVNEDCLLLGCATGLYSYHYQTKRLVHIHGLDCVDYIEVGRESNKAILIGNGQENLYQCDVRHLMTRGQASSHMKPKLEAQVLDLPFANRNCNERWHLAKITGSHDQMMAVAATSSRIVILKFDVGKQIFKPVRALDTAMAVSTVLFTRHTAIVSSDRFFEIDLGTYTAEEFVDISDPQASQLKRCRPMAIFKIGKNEFLLCFEEFGIYVDEYGCRSRAQEVDWTYTPTGFLFCNGILFVSHFNMVQVMRVYRSSAHEISVNYEDNEVEVDGTAIENIKAFIPLSRPRLLGPCGKLNVFCMVTLPETDTQELLVIDGMKSLRAMMSASVETLDTCSDFPSTSTLNSYE